MIFKNKERIKQYWKTLMHSTRNKIALGAQYIARIIPYARKENWRRREEKK
jgi:uncharacterized protein HemY